MLEAIRDYHEAHGYAPTVRELGELCYMASTSTVFHYLHKLSDGGYITFQPHSPRTIVLTEQGRQAL